MRVEIIYDNKNYKHSGVNLVLQRILEFIQSYLSCVTLQIDTKNNTVISYLTQRDLDLLKAQIDEIEKTITSTHFVSTTK